MRKAIIKVGKKAHVFLLAGFIALYSNPALANPPGFGNLTSKIETINGGLVALGGVLAITGFVWACLAIMIGLGGAAKAVTVLLVGLAIASAPEIVGFLV